MNIKLIWLFVILLSFLKDNSKEVGVTGGHAISQAKQTSHPPIPIPVNLKKAAYVTLVIENDNGIRVRNLISEKWLKAGLDTVWWDGLDDSGRDIYAARHGVYHIPGHFVEPGSYHVRGLIHQQITPHYEFPVYSEGMPPWNTNDHKGAWLANHTPPQSALFVPGNESPAGEPAVFLGAYVTEGPDGLIWVDLNGKKLGGMKWVGGAWTAAPFLARDQGKRTIMENQLYVASCWQAASDYTEAELRISTLSSGNDKKLLVYPMGKIFPDYDYTSQIAGLAVFDGVVVVSLTKKNQLLFFDIRKNAVIGTLPIESPTGLAFDQIGRLLVLSSNKLIRFNIVSRALSKSSAENLIISGLDDPRGITTDDIGHIYISNGGISQQVKVFSDRGLFIRSVGHAGPPRAGQYDPLHMNNPMGLTIDSKQHLWVAECDYLPKRISVWTLDGHLIKAFYGPGKYGGGGTIDKNDKSKFYYADDKHGAMEFSLNWKLGKYKLKRIYYRPNSSDLPLAEGNSPPESEINLNGKHYFTNCYNSNPTNGSLSTFIFSDDGNIVHPIAAAGQASTWAVLKDQKFSARWPPGVDLNRNNTNNNVFFIWSDLNNNNQVEPEEVTFKMGYADGITVMPDLSFCVANFDEKSVQFSPEGFTNTGVPRYTIERYKVLADNVKPRTSTGGSQMFTSSNGWAVITLGSGEFDNLSLSGAKNGKTMWSYPDIWPGLHASHEAPVPDQSGELIGTTRLLGEPITFKANDTGPIWAINGNHGTVYFFTVDGLFISTLFEPMRSGKQWTMPKMYREMNLSGLTLGEENFWPTLSKTSDEAVYITDNTHGGVLRVSGLETVECLPVKSLTISKQDLTRCAKYFNAIESIQQSDRQKKVIQVSVHSTKTISVDGKLNDWVDADWVDIDKSGVKAYFNSNTKPNNVAAALAIENGFLYAAFKTDNPQLLENSGEMAQAPFKTGGALDIMIGTNYSADPNRTNPVPGDLRLLVTMVKGSPKALIYRPITVGDNVTPKVSFSSPARTITFDRIDDVTSDVKIMGADGNFEISIPLAKLGLDPKPGVQFKGDIGVLRGDGSNTISRNYWNNKATGTVADVPSEAELTPSLWGIWEFRNK